MLESLPDRSEHFSLKQESAFAAVEKGLLYLQNKENQEVAIDVNKKFDFSKSAEVNDMLLLACTIKSLINTPWGHYICNEGP